MSRKHMHLRRYDDTWSVKGVLMVHPPKPTLSKREAIGEQVLDWLDIAEQANCLSDGLVIDCESIDWHLTASRAPWTSESRRYNVHVAARLDLAAKAKRKVTSTVEYGKDRDPYTGLPIRRDPSGFIAVTTRRFRR